MINPENRVRRELGEKGIKQDKAGFLGGNRQKWKKSQRYNKITNTNKMVVKYYFKMSVDLKYI